MVDLQCVNFFYTSLTVLDINIFFSIGIYHRILDTVPCAIIQ